MALATIKASTAAMESGSAADDHEYARVDQQIASIAAERNELASQIKAILDGVAFEGRPFDEGQAQRLIDQSKALLQRADEIGSRNDQ